MLKKLVLVAGVLLAIANSSHADIFFSQDFSSSNTLSDYFNLSSPTVNQFNGIQTSGIGTTATITNDDLVFTRVSGNSGSANRIALNGTTALSSSLVTFNLSAGGAAGTTAGVLSLGSGTDFGTQVSAPVNANIHSRIGINLTGAGFSLRSIGASTISAAFTGNQTVFWFTNNTGNAFNYLDPTSGSTTLANDVSDIWVGSTKVLTIAAQTGTVDITSFKFSTDFNLNNQFIAFDSIQISDLVIVAVPEPNSIALISVTGCLGFIAAFRRRKPNSIVGSVGI